MAPKYSGELRSFATVLADRLMEEGHLTIPLFDVDYTIAMFINSAQKRPLKRIHLVHPRVEARVLNRRQNHGASPHSWNGSMRGQMSCGGKIHSWATNQVRQQKDWHEVTCPRCMKTRNYKKAQEQYPREGGEEDGTKKSG